MAKKHHIPFTPDAFRGDVPVCVITGAGSGIGRALSVKLAEMGAVLAISDINREGLEQTRDQIEAVGAAVHAQVLDVTQKEAVFAYADQVVEHFSKVNMVFNNAGAALNGDFETLSVEDYHWQMDINFWGVVHGTMAFLPHLKQSGWGHIINISSVFGLIATQYNSAYNASKFAVRGMTEALRIELDEQGGTVSCSCVHPGGVKTNIAQSGRTGRSNTFGGGATREEVAAKFDKVARTSPEKAADIIISGALKNKKRILVGMDAWLIDKIQRITPTHYSWLLYKLFDTK